MNPVAEYIRKNYHSMDDPVTGSQLSAVFGVKDIEIRRLINEARSSGEPICSCGKGYYYSENTSDICRTIDSMRGRIQKQENAISGLCSCCASVIV